MYCTLAAAASTACSLRGGAAWRRAPVEASAAAVAVTVALCGCAYGLRKEQGLSLLQAKIIMFSEISLKGFERFVRGTRHTKSPQIGTGMEVDKRTN